jgi:hypothetical protein
MNRFCMITFALLFLTGCLSTQTPTVTPTITITPLVDQSVPVITESPLTPTHQPDPTWTLPATLPIQDAASKVNELLQTNGTCRLPCWWGIVPGQTKWEDARSMLFPLAKSFDDSYSKAGEFFPGLLVYYSADGDRFFEQDYTVRDGIVQEIKIKLPGVSPFSNPKGILDEYGVPDEIYVGGEYEPEVVNWQSFWIFFYYSKQRIFVEYDQGMEPIQPPSSSLSICFSDVYYSELHVWGPEYSFDQNLNFIFEQHGNSHKPLEKVTSLTIAEFHTLFTDLSQAPCFETPAKNWLP